MDRITERVPLCSAERWKEGMTTYEAPAIEIIGDVVDATQMPDLDDGSIRVN